MCGRRWSVWPSSLSSRGHPEPKRLARAARHHVLYRAEWGARAQQAGHSPHLDTRHFRSEKETARKKLGAGGKGGGAGLVGGARASGTIPLGGAPAVAGPPGPECGPTRFWICVVPGCPDCPVFQFVGTYCEMIAYEHRTGRV